MLSNASLDLPNPLLSPFPAREGGSGEAEGIEQPYPCKTNALCMKSTKGETETETMPADFSGKSESTRMFNIQPVHPVLEKRRGEMEANGSDSVLTLGLD